MLLPSGHHAPIADLMCVGSIQPSGDNSSMGQFSRIMLVALAVVTAACTAESASDPSTAAAAPGGATSPTEAAAKDSPAPQPTAQEKLESLARQLDPGTSLLVDQETLLDDVSAGNDGKTLIFKYTLLTDAVARSVKSGSTQLQDHVKSHMCGNLDQSQVLRDGYVLELVYTDLQGNEVARFGLDAKACP